MKDEVQNLRKWHEPAGCCTRVHVELAPKPPQEKGKVVLASPWAYFLLSCAELAADFLPHNYTTTLPS